MATDTLRNHWVDAPEWRNERRLWALYLTFAEQHALRARILRDQQALSGLTGLAPIPLPRIHLTVQGIAFQDEVGEPEIDRFTDVVAGALGDFPVPTLQAMAAEPVQDAVCLPIRPAGHLNEIREMIRSTAARELGSVNLYELPLPPGGFDPHISIGYADSFIPADELALAMLRTEQNPTPVTVSHLSLIDLTRADRAWSWTRERRLPIGVRTAAAQRV